jgi:transposase InsO family protein
MTFTNDATRFVWIYTLHRKSDALSSFQHFNKHYAAPAGGVNISRSDNGTEYTNRAFEECLGANGTLIQRTTPYTPSQNPVAERANRTIHEMANSNLIPSGMPARFWGEAVFTSAYTRNHCPTAAAGDVSPIVEALTGVKPDISHLRAFGCAAYVYVPKRKQKFQPKAARRVLLGYAAGVKAYRLWDICPEDRHRSQRSFR